MPRPRKNRKVCQLPPVRSFCPAQQPPRGTVVLTVDEYETLRLIDHRGFSQEECAGYMQVARTTVQHIYDSARKKVAQMLVEGQALQIEGGQYALCDGSEDFCGCGGCARHRNAPKGEEQAMKIAIPLDEDRQSVCLVLARAPYFLFREKGSDTVLENPAAHAQSGAGVQAAQFLADQHIDVLITPRCGENAAQVFEAAKVTIYKSLGATAAEDLAALGSGTLQPLTQFHGGYHGL